MTKTQMPEPVAKVIQRSEWGDAPAFIGNGKPHPPTGTLLITTTQAEAYANARVREALEEAAMICWEMQSKPEYGKDDKDRWLAIAEHRIRALIPDPPCPNSPIL